MNERQRNALDRFITTDPWDGCSPADAHELPAEPDADAQGVAATNERATELDAFYARVAESVGRMNSSDFRDLEFWIRSILWHRDRGKNCDEAIRNAARCIVTPSPII